MKKFKSLMLAALASAALAAPSFADGHEGPNFGVTGVSGEIILGMKYTTATPDGGDTKTVQKTYVGDVNFTFSSDFYKLTVENDDEDTDSNINLNIFGSATSGDNTITASATMEDIANETSGVGDVFVVGSNKTLSLKAGKFGVSGHYYNGLGYYRASAGLTASNQFTDDSEDLVILGHRGIQADVNAGDIQLSVALPWFEVGPDHIYALESSTNNVSSYAGTGAVTTTVVVDKDGVMLSEKKTYANAVETKTAGKLTTNVTGIRPAITMNLGSASISAMVYSLNFSAQDGSDTVDKTDSGYTLQGKMTAGQATIGLGFTSNTKKEGNVETTPSVLNGSVVVALGGGSQAGASFDIVGDGAETDEATATRFSASYGMPFFVEALTLKLGAGTSTQSSDDKTKAGTASGLEAEWVYNF
jgi:hypothetical protein